MIRLPFLKPAVPPHVFVLLPEGVTYARVRLEELPRRQEADGHLLLDRHPEAKSVHLEQFPAVPSEWKDEALAEKWRKVRQVRRVVTGALEIERAALERDGLARWQCRLDRGRRT